MKNRAAVCLSLVAVLLAPSLSASAQSRTSRRADAQAAPAQAEVLAGAIRAISRMHMQAFSDSALWEAAIDGLIASLNDPYAELFTAQESEQWERETTGNYSGIGLQITLLQNEVTVTAVFRGFPAFEAGIEIGDVIVGVDGQDARGWTTETTANAIRGPAGSRVRVSVKRQGYDAPLDFEITRAEVHVPAVQWGMLEGGIAYAVMDRVARGAAKEMEAVLDSLGDDARGLIIDLRRNPGGFLDESLMLADLFLEPGSTLASTVQRVPGGPVDQPETDSYTDRWPVRVPNLPMVVLVDGFTASGAEILAGALQDYDRALVIGERTFGKGVVQTVMELPHGRRLRFTTGSWLTPLGRSLQRDRDSQGRPLPETGELPRIASAGGRTLVAGGGIFPDLEVPEDTLVTAEQELVRVTTEMQFPLALRLTELGFRIASERRQAGGPADVRDDEYAAFVGSLVREGLPAGLASDPNVSAYLRWRARIAVAQRLGDIGAEADIRAERDLALKEAIRLLSTARTQADLFEAAAREATALRSARTTR
jgi:carboxyl-terminal processing protease